MARVVLRQPSAAPAVRVNGTATGKTPLSLLAQNKADRVFFLFKILCNYNIVEVLVD